MAMRTVIFEVDTGQLFDMIAEVGGDMSSIGSRVIGSLLADPGFSDILGMAIYGIHMPVNQTHAHTGEDAAHD